MYCLSGNPNSPSELSAAAVALDFAAADSAVVAAVAAMTASHQRASHPVAPATDRRTDRFCPKPDPHRSRHFRPVIPPAQSPAHKRPTHLSLAADLWAALHW